MAIIDTIKTIFSGSNIIDSVSNAVDKFVTTSAEKEKLKQELLKIQTDYDLKKAELLGEVEKAYLADTANARDMQKAALAQDDKFAKRFIYYLAAFVLATTIGFGVVLCFVAIPEANRRLVEMFFDVFLFSGALSVIYFFFGSSHGSQKKTDIINRNNQ